MKVWQLKPADESLIQNLAEDTNIPPEFVRILVVRGVSTKEEVRIWLNPRLTDLHPSELLPGFDTVVSRIQQAIEQRERILVWGHDDLDGITAVLIMVKVLSSFQATVDYHIPVKGRDKHGLDARLVAALPADKKPGLIITVDCGISNHSDIADLRQQGVDVIVTDHHEVVMPLPPALAVVDPKRSDSEYPYDQLTGAGVALKLMMGFVAHRLGLSVTQFVSALPELLELVTLGTVADRAPLTGENRILVKLGFDQLMKTRLPALRAVLDNLRNGNEQMTVSTFLTELLPLFAAANGSEGVRKFLSHDVAEVQAWVKELTVRSQEWRQEAERTFQLAQAHVRLGDGILFVQHPELSLRALGFSAARLKDRYQVPAIVIGRRDDVWVGECRGIDGVDLMDLLRAHRNFFIDFGGHKKAAGFTISPDRVDDFIVSAERFAHENFAGRIIPENQLTADAALPFSRFNTEICRLAPFGEGNPEPVLISEPVHLIPHEKGFVPDTRPDLILFCRRNGIEVQPEISYSVLYTVDDMCRLWLIDLRSV